MREHRWRMGEGIIKMAEVPAPVSPCQTPPSHPPKRSSDVTPSESLPDPSELSLRPQCQGSDTFSRKGWIVYILGSVGHMVSITTTNDSARTLVAKA